MRRKKCESAGPGPGRQALAQVSARGRWWKSILALLCGLILGVASSARAQSGMNAEYPVKLAFLYQFALFVEWPSDAFPNATSPLVVCVVGEDPFDPELEGELGSRTVDKHHMVIRRLKRGSDSRACHMVFVPHAESRQGDAIVGSLKGLPVLTVGETNGFAEGGGIVNFTFEGNKLRFEINLDAASRTPLRISSKVLAMARIVRDPPHPGAFGGMPVSPDAAWVTGSLR